MTTFRKMDKTSLRKALMAQRRTAQQQERRNALTHHEAMTAWLRAQLPQPAVLGSYKPIRSESDPGPLLAQLAQQEGLRLAFPRVLGQGLPLTFLHTTTASDFEAGAFGVLEPKLTRPEAVPDVLLVPLVGFDQAGYRLGYGGGFYDRTLAKLRALKPILACGFAYDGQLSAQRLDFEPTDLALDAVMTPTRLYDFRGQAPEVRPWS